MNIEQHAAFRDKAQQSSLIKIELIGSPPPPNQQIDPTVREVSASPDHTAGEVGGAGWRTCTCAWGGGPHTWGQASGRMQGVCMCVAFAGICLHGS